MGVAECEFCGDARESLAVAGLPWAVYKPCMCEGAVANRSAEDREAESRAEEAKETDRRFQVARFFEEIPDHFRDRTFESYRVTPENRAAYLMARNWPPTGGKQSLLFMGEPGTGKTHLAAAIAINQVKLNRAVIFGTVPTILGRIKATFDDNRASEAEVKRIIMGCSLLVLDDLGKEKPSEWVEEVLYEIINARYVKKLPVIITTNVGLKAVEARYAWNGKAITSRLFEMCTGANVGGEDYRRRRC